MEINKKEMIKIGKYSLLCLVSGLLTVNAYAQNLNIDECRNLAIANNNKLKQAALEIRMSEETGKETFTGYFPTVSAEGFAVNANTDMAKINFGIPGVGNMPLSMFKNGKTAAVTAMQPVFTGGRIVNGNKLAAIGTDVAKLQMDITEDEVILNTEAYFWHIVSLKEKLITVELLEKQLDNIYKDVKTAIDAGVSMPNDLLRVDLHKQELKSTALKLENGVNVVSLLLAQYIGMPDSVIDITYNGFIEPVDPEHVYFSAYEASRQRNEYKLMQKAVDSGQLKSKIEMGKNLPSVGVGAGYVYHDFTGRDNNFGMLYASVSIPVSGWWGGSHAVKREKLKTKQAVIEKDNARELLEVQIIKTWNDLNEAYKQIDLAQTSIKSAEENMRINTDYYNVGLSTMTDLLDAQTLLRQSYDRLTDSYTDYQLKMTQYLIATNQSEIE